MLCAGGPYAVILALIVATKLLVLPNLLPDFLLVGASKCGTTSLHRYLRSHPELFLPEFKEPRFFDSKSTAELSDEDPRSAYFKEHIVTDLQAYQQLFAPARPGQKLGEASVSYLYQHRNTVPRIKALLPKARILICLRDPVARAFSAYTQLVRDGYETLTFEQGLAREPQRRAQKWTPMYAYLDQGFYCQQVRAFMHGFDHVKVIITEELQQQPELVMSEIYRFLGVDPEHVAQTDQKFNVSGIPRRRGLYALLMQDNAVKRGLRPALEKIVTPARINAIKARLSARMLERPEMKASTRVFLVESYAKDVARLEQLLGRKLDCWQRE